jgi:hypothetical protein
VPLPYCTLSKFGQHEIAEDLEYVPVSVKAGDRDAAEAVEHPPFLRLMLEVCPVGRQVCQSENLYPVTYAFPDLAAHLSEAGPPHIETWQRPLQEGSTIGIVHDTAA